MNWKPWRKYVSVTRWSSVRMRFTLTWYLLDGDTEDLLPGLHAYDGKGHTMGAQFFAVARPKG